METPDTLPPVTPARTPAAEVEEPVEAEAPEAPVEDTTDEVDAKTTRLAGGRSGVTSHGV